MELLVVALVVLGFVAIIARFVPRDDAGRAGLPRIVDQSIGMWALRRLTRRPLGQRTANDSGARLDRSALIARSRATEGSPDRAGTVPPSVVRFVASVERLRALGIQPARPGGSTRKQPLERPIGRATIRRRRPAETAGTLTAQRGLVLVAAAFVVAVVVLAAALAPRGTSGDVLGGTHGPAIDLRSSLPSAVIGAQPGSTPTPQPTPKPSKS
jgi:hypothetical protein